MITYILIYVIGALVTYIVTKHEFTNISLDTSKNDYGTFLASMFAGPIIILEKLIQILIVSLSWIGLVAYIFFKLYDKISEDCDD